MKKIVTAGVFCLLFLVWSCKNDEKVSLEDQVIETPECDLVKTGKFKYANPAYGEWIIDRNDSTSIEISNQTDLKIYSSVNWITDCEYELTITDTENLDNMKVVSQVVRVVITQVTDYGYKCISYTVDGPEEFEMIRINE